MNNIKKTPAIERTITDDEILAFLDAKEEGKSFPDALSASGMTGLSQAETLTLRDFWEMHGNLVRSAHNMTPSHNLLARIVEEAGDGGRAQVTEGARVGYTGASQERSIIHINSYLNSFMQMNWKIAAPIAVVVIAVVSVISMGGGAEKTSPAASIAQNGDVVAAKTTAAPVAMMAKQATSVSGSIDDLAALVVKEADGDAALLDDGTADVALVRSDSQSLSDMNTAYDETTF